jgi:hypothetical protein
MKSRTPTDHDLPRDSPGDAFVMAPFRSRAVKPGDSYGPKTKTAPGIGQGRLSCKESE